jgi:hypothetical protein
MTEIIQNPATDITAADYETFDQYSSRVYHATKMPLRYADPREDEDGNRINPGGLPIELNPELHYSFLMLGMERLATPAEFATIFTVVGAALKQLEQQGKIPADMIKTVATPFNVKVPKIPEEFAPDSRMQEGEPVIKSYLTGEVAIAVVREYPQSTEPDESDEH